MAEGDDGQEKTEEPTQKRRDNARRDGQVVTSKEMFVLASTVAAAMMLALGPLLAGGIPAKWAGYFRFGRAEDLDALVLDRLGQSMTEVLVIGLSVGVPLLVMTLLMQAAIGGLNFAPKAMAFKASKINPGAGLKRMVSMRALVELSKAILKVVLLLLAAVGVMFEFLPQLNAMIHMAPANSLGLLTNGMVRILAAMCISLAVIGGVDLGYQLFSHNKKLKMSRQEVKEETKESEGSPEVKGQIRRLQMEASRNTARRRKAVDDVPEATTVITNPTHFAVALKYIPGETNAPIIVALGRGAMAHDIIDRAKSARVTIMQVPPLARALYYTGDVGWEISEQLFAAVAAILAHVHRLENGLNPLMPDIELPEELMLDEFGRPLKGDTA